MKQQRLRLRLLFWIVFCGLALRFPSAQVGAEERPAPSPTVPPSVRWVGVRNSKGEERQANVVYAQRGDEIWVDIINFDDWVNHLEKKPDNVTSGRISYFISIIFRSTALPDLLA